MKPWQKNAKERQKKSDEELEEIFDKDTARQIIEYSKEKYDGVIGELPKWMNEYHLEKAQKFKLTRNNLRKSRQNVPR